MSYWQTGFFICCFLFCAHLEASCCSSASSGGIGRLLAHERALVEIGSAVRYQLGSFDNKASFAFSNIAHLPHIEFEEELQIMTRLFDFFEPYIRIPVRIRKSKIRTGSNLADMNIGARIPVFKEGFIKHFPSLTFVGSVRAPTGYSHADAHLENEYITSMGEWLFSLGVLLEKDLYDLVFGLGYSVAAEADYFKNSLLTSGLIHSPLFTLGIKIHENGFLSCSLSGIFHAAHTANQKTIDDSDGRKVTVGMSYAVNLHSHIKANAQIGSDVPLAYFGKNFNNELFFRLGLRFGIF